MLDQATFGRVGQPQGDAAACGSRGRAAKSEPHRLRQVFGPWEWRRQRLIDKTRLDAGHGRAEMAAQAAAQAKWACAKVGAKAG